jgi:hypothetical protein
MIDDSLSLRQRVALYRTLRHFGVVNPDKRASLPVFRVRMDAAYTRIGAVIHRAKPTFGSRTFVSAARRLPVSPHIDGWAQSPTLSVDGGLPGGPGRLNGGRS